ncbi:MAG: LysR family transcriptional regulator [Myxococcota bacterium]
MIENLNWDDIKFFLALSRGGSLPRAAEKLGVSEGTVSRRILAMEKNLGARLFDRTPSGHVHTELGGRVEDIADRIASDVDLFYRAVEGEDRKLDGTLVVTIPPTLLSTWVLSIIRDFAQQHPQISLELRETGSLENLHQRAADVAIRSTNAPPPGLVGRRVVRLAFATYATQELAEADEKHWIGWVDRSGEAEWNAGPFGEAPVHHRVSSAWAAFDAARQGLGIARLECYLADPEPRLVRIDQAYFERSIWMLTHEGLRRTARVRAFQDFVYKAMTADRSRIEADATEFRLSGS